MSDEYMLVRLQGGDVIRRRVVAASPIHNGKGDVVFVLKQPELKNGEMLFRTLGDPIPMVVA